MGKGDQICIRGYLQNRSWEDKDGNKRRSAEVVADQVYFAGSKRDASAPPPAAAEPKSGEFQEMTDDDGKLPF